MNELEPATRWTRWPADGVITYQLAGAIDYAAAFSLYRQALEDLLASERVFVLDCTEVKSIDQKGIDVLMRLSQRILEVHGRLTFDHVTAEVYALLEAAKFTNVFLVNRS